MAEIKVKPKRCSWCRRSCVDGVVYETKGKPPQRLLFHKKGRCLWNYKRMMGLV